MFKYRIGIDLGGTKIEGIVLNAPGEELFRKRVDTQQDKGYAHILGRIKELHDELAARIQDASHSFGIGTPGAISPRTGRLKNSNTVCMNGQPVKADLEQILGRKIEIQNDANCFAMAEALHGAGRGKKLVFGVIMGTGCGGGIVHKGEVITGPQAIAGEWGHMSIDPKARNVTVANWVAWRRSSAAADWKRATPNSSGRRSFKKIVQDYYAGDAKVVEFMKVFFRWLGRSVANLIDVLDPDVVVLGGGVSNFDALYTEGVAEVAKYVFSDSLETPIVKHQLGDSAGVIGAALIGV